MKESLQNIKEALFDAPSEVKSAFNQVVEYFDDKVKYGIVDFDPSKKVFNNPLKVKSFKVADLKSDSSLPMKWAKDAKKELGLNHVYVITVSDGRVYCQA